MHALVCAGGRGSGKVNPWPVARDQKGQLYTVRYEAVHAMLLNERVKGPGKVQQLEEGGSKGPVQVQRVSAQVE